MAERQEVLRRAAIIEQEIIKEKSKQQEIQRRAAIMEQEMLSQRQKQLEIQERIKNDNKISEETIKAAAQIKQSIIQDQETSNQQSPESKKEENKDQVGEIIPKQDPKDVPDSDDDTV